MFIFIKKVTHLFGNFHLIINLLDMMGSGLVFLFLWNKLECCGTILHHDLMVRKNDHWFHCKMAKAENPSKINPKVTVLTGLPNGIICSFPGQ